MRLAAPSPPESHHFICMRARVRFAFQGAEGLEHRMLWRKNRSGEILGHYQEVHSTIHLTLLLNALLKIKCAKKA